MISFIKSLKSSFNQSDETFEVINDSYHEPVTQEVEVGCESEVSEKNISEPILTFVETVKKDSNRFVYKEVALDSYIWGSSDTSILYDKYLKINYLVKIVQDCFRGKIKLRGKDYIGDSFKIRGVRFKPNNVQDLSWVTEDEWEFLKNELYDGVYLKYNTRRSEVMKKWDKRKELRNNRKEREKVKSLYCKEEL